METNTKERTSHENLASVDSISSNTNNVTEIHRENFTSTDFSDSEEKNSSNANDFKNVNLAEPSKTEANNATENTNNGSHILDEMNNKTSLTVPESTTSVNLDSMLKNRTEIELNSTRSDTNATPTNSTFVEFDKTDNATNMSVPIELKKVDNATELKNSENSASIDLTNTGVNNVTQLKDSKKNLNGSNADSLPKLENTESIASVELNNTKTDNMFAHENNENFTDLDKLKANHPENTTSAELNNTKVGDTTEPTTLENTGSVNPKKDFVLSLDDMLKKFAEANSRN